MEAILWFGGVSRGISTIRLFLCSFLMALSGQQCTRKVIEVFAPSKTSALQKLALLIALYNSKAPVLVPRSFWDIAELPLRTF